MKPARIARSTALILSHQRMKPAATAATTAMVIPIGPVIKVTAVADKGRDRYHGG